jgi:ribonuclease E
MPKSLIVSEKANIAALLDRGKAVEFFFQGNGFSIGDIYSARVENILPSIDAVFLNLGSEKMGFLHASDIPGHGHLSDRVWPKQKLLVQITKEPTSNKGPRVSTDITLIGRFFVLTTEHDNIILSRRIASNSERARLKSIATLLKPSAGFGLVVRTEAIGASERELEEDFRELFLERWKYIIDRFESQRRPSLIMSDSGDLLYKVLRDIFHEGVDEVAVDNPEAQDRAQFYLNKWGSHRVPTVQMKPTKKLLQESGLLDELHLALSPKLELPSGGYLYIQPTEALTVIDVNSGKFTSSKSPEETVLLTNLEAATEAARQLRLRNVGGVIVIDFIDMENRSDRLTVLEHFEKLLEQDPAHPQIGRLSDLGLVELTRHRQEQTLYEALGQQCNHCHGIGLTFPIFEMFGKDSTDDDEYSDQNVIQKNLLPESEMGYLNLDRNLDNNSQNNFQDNSQNNFRQNSENQFNRSNQNNSRNRQDRQRPEYQNREAEYQNSKNQNFKNQNDLDSRDAHGEDDQYQGEYPNRGNHRDFQDNNQDELNFDSNSEGGSQDSLRGSEQNNRNQRNNERNNQSQGNRPRRNNERNPQGRSDNRPDGRSRNPRFNNRDNNQRQGSQDRNQDRPQRRNQGVERTRYESNQNNSGRPSSISDLENALVNPLIPSDNNENQNESNQSSFAGNFESNRDFNQNANYESVSYQNSDEPNVTRQSLSEPINQDNQISDNLSQNQSQSFHENRHTEYVNSNHSENNQASLNQNHKQEAPQNFQKQQDTTMQNTNQEYSKSSSQKEADIPITMPTFTLKEKSTEVLPGVYSFDIEDNS